MSPRCAARVAPLAALLTALCLGTAAALAAGGALPSRVAMAIAIAFLPYGGLLVAPRSMELRGALVFAGFTGLALALAPTVLSDDLYRYLWDGRVLRAGIDPYAHAPADPALAGLRDELWTRVNHPRIPTIYPPLAQLVFGTLGFLFHHPLTLKLFALGAHLGAVPIVARLADGARFDPRRAAALYALNPLALSESALGGHVDAFAGLLLALFALALLRGRLGAAVAAVVGAAGVKLVGLLLAPLLWRQSRIAAVVGMGLGAACLWPLLAAGGDEAVGGLGQYARRWGGNAGAHAWVEAGIERLVEETHGIGEGRVRFEGLREHLDRWQGTRLDPMASFQPEKKQRGDPAELESSVVGALGARALVVIALLGVALVWAGRRPRAGEPPDPRHLIRAARALLLAGLLLAPQVHPWYLLWLLPFDVALGGGAGLVFTSAVLVAYAPLDGWVTGRSWVEAPSATLFEHGLVWAFVAIELLRVWGRRGALAGEGAKIFGGSGVSHGV